MSTTPQHDRIALDAAAVVQSLSRCAAEMQAKAAAQKALVQAATSRKLGLVAADAALMAEIYEDAAATLFLTIQNILTGGSGTVGGAATPSAVSSTPPNTHVPSALQRHCDTFAPTTSPRCRRAEDVKLSAQDRYSAFVGMVRDLPGSTTAALPLPDDVYAHLEGLYAAITDKLPDLGEVAKALKGMETDWQRDEGYAPATKRQDWFSKMYSHINSLQKLRSQIVADTTALMPQLTTNYEKLIDVVAANMTSQQWPSSIAPMATATEKELRRLRDDCGVVATLLKLRRGDGG